MLEDVRLARMVVRWCSEENGEDVVHVLAVKVDMLRASRQMRALVRPDLKVVDIGDLINLPCSMQDLALLEAIRHSISAPRNILSDLMRFSSFLLSENELRALFFCLL